MNLSVILKTTYIWLLVICKTALWRARRIFNWPLRRGLQKIYGKEYQSGTLQRKTFLGAYELKREPKIICKTPASIKGEVIYLDRDLTEQECQEQKEIIKQIECEGLDVGGK